MNNPSDSIPPLLGIDPKGDEIKHKQCKGKYKVIHQMVTVKMEKPK